MSVEQPVLDTNYKHLISNVNKNLDKTTAIITIMSLAIIIAQSRKDNIG